MNLTIARSKAPLAFSKLNEAVMEKLKGKEKDSKDIMYDNYKIHHSKLSKEIKPKEHDNKKWISVDNLTQALTSLEKDYVSKEGCNKLLSNFLELNSKLSDKLNKLKSTFYYHVL